MRKFAQGFLFELKRASFITGTSAIQPMLQKLRAAAPHEMGPMRGTKQLISPIAKAK